MTNSEILSKAKLLGEGEWYKDSAYRVYELDGKYYSVIVANGWGLMDEYLEEITKEQVNEYIEYEWPQI